MGTNSLGFPSLRFQSTAADAVVLLRAGALEEALNTADLLSAESTLEGRGVAEREAFRRLLHETATKDSQAA